MAETLRSLTSQLDKAVNQNLKFLNEGVASDVFKLLIVVFATKVIPPLPSAVTNPLNFTVLRILAIWMIVWAQSGNPTRSLAIAVGFIVAINLLSGRGPFNSPDVTEGFGLLANIHDPDIYYMKNRAKHEADFREKDLVRRFPNRVHAVVRENNRQAQDVLYNDSDEMSNANPTSADNNFSYSEPVDNITY